MKTNILLYLFLLTLNGCVNGNSSDTHENPVSSITPKAKTLQQSSKTLGANAPENIQLSSMVPNGFFILDSAIGATGTNGEQHIALVLAANEENEDLMESEIPRRVLMLKNVSGELIKVARNDDLILCKMCGGIFGDPYNGIELKNNILKISNYGGSAWRWNANYTFRFQHNEWQLIGATYDSYFNAKDCGGDGTSAGRQLEDINFSTGKMRILHTYETECTPYQDDLIIFGKKSPISLSNFPGSPNQWPRGKIKDGDGKE